jgi:hypothetical protein
MTYAAFIDDLLRPRIHDTDKAGYTDPELFTVVETALLHLYATAAAAKKSAFVKTLMVIHYGKVPLDFGGFCGQVPVRQEDGRFKILTGENSLEARYHPTPPSGASLISPLPLQEKYLPILLDLCAVRALNSNEFDTTQDQAISNALLESVAGMME